MRNPFDKTELTKEAVAALFVLDTLKGFVPQKFKALWEAELTPQRVIKDPALIPLQRKTGDKLRNELSKIPQESVEDCAGGPRGRSTRPGGKVAAS